MVDAANIIIDLDQAIASAIRGSRLSGGRIYNVSVPNLGQGRYAPTCSEVEFASIRVVDARLNGTDLHTGRVAHDGDAVGYVTVRAIGTGILWSGVGTNEGDAVWNYASSAFDLQHTTMILWRGRRFWSEDRPDAGATRVPSRNRDAVLARNDRSPEEPKILWMENPAIDTLFGLDEGAYRANRRPDQLPYRAYIGEYGVSPSPRDGNLDSTDSAVLGALDQLIQHVLEPLLGLSRALAPDVAPLGYQRVVTELVGRHLLVRALDPEDKSFDSPAIGNTAIRIYRSPECMLRITQLAATRNRRLQGVTAGMGDPEAIELEFPEPESVAFPDASVSSGERSLIGRWTRWLARRMVADGFQDPNDPILTGDVVHEAALNEHYFNLSAEERERYRAAFFDAARASIWPHAYTEENAILWVDVDVGVNEPKVAYVDRVEATRLGFGPLVAEFFPNQTAVQTIRTTSDSALADGHIQLYLQFGFDPFLGGRIQVIRESSVSVVTGLRFVFAVIELTLTLGTLLFWRPEITNSLQQSGRREAQRKFNILRLLRLAAGSMETASRLGPADAVIEDAIARLDGFEHLVDRCLRLFGNAPITPQFNPSLMVQNAVVTEADGLMLDLAIDTATLGEPSAPGVPSCRAVLRSRPNERARMLIGDTSEEVAAVYEDEPWQTEGGAELRLEVPFGYRTRWFRLDFNAPMSPVEFLSGGWEDFERMSANGWLTDLGFGPSASRTAIDLESGPILHAVQILRPGHRRPDRWIAIVTTPPSVSLRPKKEWLTSFEGEVMRRALAEQVFQETIEPAWRLGLGDVALGELIDRTLNHPAVPRNVATVAMLFLAESNVLSELTTVARWWLGDPYDPDSGSRDGRTPHQFVRDARLRDIVDGTFELQLGTVNLTRDDYLAISRVRHSFALALASAALADVDLGAVDANQPAEDPNRELRSWYQASVPEAIRLQFDAEIEAARDAIGGRELLARPDTFLRVVPKPADQSVGFRNLSVVADGEESPELPGPDDPLRRTFTRCRMDWQVQFRLEFVGVDLSLGPLLVRIYLRSGSLGPIPMGEPTHVAVDVDASLPPGATHAVVTELVSREVVARLRTPWNFVISEPPENLQATMQVVVTQAGLEVGRKDASVPLWSQRIEWTDAGQRARSASEESGSDARNARERWQEMFGRRRDAADVVADRPDVDDILGATEVWGDGAGSLVGTRQAVPDRLAQWLQSRKPGAKLIPKPRPRPDRPGEP